MNWTDVVAEHSSMAQLVERMAVNHKVRGSNPRGGVCIIFMDHEICAVST
jgi:hypothetical protein